MPSDYRDFISKCLKKDPAMRANIDNLEEHSFLQDASDLREEWKTERNRLVLFTGDSTTLPGADVPPI